MLGRCLRPCGPLSQRPHRLIRPVSTASAIQRGIGRLQGKVQRRSSQDETEYPERRRGPRNALPERRLQREDAWSRPSLRRKPDSSARNSRPAQTPSRSSRPAEAPSPFPNRRVHAQYGRAIQETKSRDRSRFVASRQQQESLDQDHMPISVPHTTAASEFLYGRSAVEAALKAKRRKLYKLYTFNPETTPDETDNTNTREPILKLARRAGVEIERLRSDRLLQKVSGGRPTNGLVLEASPLPFLKCTSLRTVHRQSSAFEITRSAQSLEEREINGTETVLQYDAHGKRYPFLLFLDGILDPGNLGGILRSAFFLGADAVILSSHGSPVTAAALKAASGAAETLPILLTRATGNFIRTSQSNGWKFFAATASSEGRRDFYKPRYTLETLGYPLTKHPSVVVLGNEGSGLWEDVEQKADYFVSIDGPRSGQDGVDSLNVSVSAALLTQAFMRASPYQTPRNRLWTDEAT